MEPEFSKDITPEQRKQVSKILFKGRLAMLGATAKFAIGLFASNMITIAIGATFFKDSDPDIIAGFNFLSMAINFIFMMVYLDRQMKAINASIGEAIKEVLKKKLE